MRAILLASTLAKRSREWAAVLRVCQRAQRLGSRDFWLELWEKEAIIDFDLKNPLQGSRRLTFMCPTLTL